MPNRDPKEQQEFDRLVAIINEGVTVWNDWRDSHPGMAIDLSDVQLRSADLRGAELRFDHPLWIGWLLAGMVSLFGEQLVGLYSSLCGHGCFVRSLVLQ